METKHQRTRILTAEQESKIPKDLAQIAIIDGYIGRLKMPEDDMQESDHAETNSTFVTHNTEVVNSNFSHTGS